ncbi:hypothetical protein ASZ78_014658 [Callipepla squamata]|uniref:Ubiquitin carboxyl-terminal hydrolase n=1 Tax=Callipepla squamata TaxID=9009 RepID=A0A226NED2_CALSU|nr:hypothetical protein ASZ78_014658 [Callipepla squamata]
MECPHLGSSVCIAPDSAKFPQGSPSSWCCSEAVQAKVAMQKQKRSGSHVAGWLLVAGPGPMAGRFLEKLPGSIVKEALRSRSTDGRRAVCRSNKSPWVCLTCSSVHCGRYVNGHAKKHYEDAQIPMTNHKKTEKQEKVQHTVCMDCSSYSTYCYRCDDFVVNDTKLGLVQKVREHLQNLEKCCTLFSLYIRQTQEKKTIGKLISEQQVTESKCKYNRANTLSFAKPLEGSTTALCATGLRNLGNTCFMNAILQSLRYFLCATRTLLMVLFPFCSRGYQQQDAHEFMRYLLDHLHLELQGGFNGVSRSVILQENSSLTASSKCCINGASTVVTAIFGGILQNEVNCLICGTESRKFDPFLDLSLDIPSQFRNKRTKNQENGPMCTLRDCLRSFTDLEELDETELYMCHKCKKKQKSTKKFWIQKLPKVRINPENSGPESCLYDLAAVVVHHGSGVGSGHYTAYAAHEGRWFHFNDSTVTLTDEETVVKAKAYILFYVERQAKSGSDKL